jgi:hypothetical protein
MHLDYADAHTSLAVTNHPGEDAPEITNPSWSRSTAGTDWPGCENGSFSSAAR